MKKLMSLLMIFSLTVVLTSTYASDEDPNKYPLPKGILWKLTPTSNPKNLPWYKYNDWKVEGKKAYRYIKPGDSHWSFTWNNARNDKAVIYYDLTISSFVKTYEECWGNVIHHLKKHFDCQQHMLISATNPTRDNCNWKIAQIPLGWYEAIYNPQDINEQQGEVLPNGDWNLSLKPEWKGTLDWYKYDAWNNIGSLTEGASSNNRNNYDFVFKSSRKFKDYLAFTLTMPYKATRDSVRNHLERHFGCDPKLIEIKNTDYESNKWDIELIPRGWVDGFTKYHKDKGNI